MRLSVLALLVVAAGCSFYARPGSETPFEPSFDDVRAAREGQALRAAPNVGRRLAQRLSDAGFQPIARADRRYALGPDTVAAGFLPGKDALQRGGLIVVAVPEGASPSALGGFAELAHTMGRLSRSYLMPAPTLVFVSLPPGREAATLAAIATSPVWPADSVRMLFVVGPLPRGTTGRSLAVQATAGATARAGYAMLREAVDANPRPDTL